jgi:hypothetical protein
MIYEVLIVLNPTETEKKEGKLEEILQAPFCIAAKDSQSAATKGLLTWERQRPIPKVDPVRDAVSALRTAESSIDDRIQVLVRPFG